MPNHRSSGPIQNRRPTQDGEPLDVRLKFSPKDRVRIEALLERTADGSLRNLFNDALQLLESMTQEMEQESEFFIKRKDKEIEPYPVFDKIPDEVKKD